MLQKGEKFVKEFQYDFAVNGGAVSSIALSSVDAGNSAALPEGMLIDMVEVICETALASGGAATVTLGNTSDVDGFMVDIFAAMNAAGAHLRTGEQAGALMWDDTNDHEITFRVTSATNTQDLILAVGTAALTAGKLRVLVHGYFPTSRDLA